MSPELNRPVSDVQVWATVSSLVTVTVVPAGTMRGDGRKAKFRMARRASFGAVVVVVTGAAVVGLLVGGVATVVGPGVEVAVVEVLGVGVGFTAATRVGVC